MLTKSALIAGSSGLVGNLLLQQLLNSDYYDKVYVLVRRSIVQSHPKLVAVVCDFDQLEKVSSFFSVDDVFCCLGTTIKKAKSRTAMNKVDRDYPIELAKLAYARGAKQFIVISAPNKGEHSRFAYTRMKGELEVSLKSIPFDSMSFIHPSLLIGDRLEFRFLENMAKSIFRGFSKITTKTISPSLGIEAKDVAKAMFHIAQQHKKGLTVYSAKRLSQLAKM